MSIHKEWPVTERRLTQEADSLGQLFQQHRERFSPELFGEQSWERLVSCASALPACLAVYPTAFLLPLHARRPGSDLGISVVGDTGPAAFFEDQGRAAGAGSSATGIAQLLSASEAPDAPLRQVVGRKMILEYAIDSAPRDVHPDPGIFLRPAERPIIGDGNTQRLDDLGMVHDAVVSALGWRPNDEERRWVAQVHGAQTPHTRIDSLGASPTRARAIHLAVSGFRNAGEVGAFLQASGWEGTYSRLTAVLSALQARATFANLGIHFDVSARGLGPTLGLSLLAKAREPDDPQYWLDSSGQWGACLEALRAEGLGVSEKLSALTDWTQGPAVLFGESGAFVLLRGIHHIKLVLSEDEIQEVRAYAFMILLGGTFT